ncbi:MAG: DNA primase [Bacteroidetes bacterium]|nr:DNA primase [Bacteroidota bacterium]MCA0446531.1 DNA primase [Bacteroidota bacterium]
MKFTDQFIASVQDANDVLDIVSERVQMKKKGTNYWGNCPFHNEKTPSFSVNPAKRIFKCFGCGKGGSVFNFIMEYENVSFYDAVKILAEKAHIELPKNEREQSENFSAEDSLYEVNRWAAKIFFENLKLDDGKPTRDYLEKRGITNESIVKFGVGYAHSGWDDLKSSAYRDQVRTELLEQLGLIIRGENGSTYDRFRDRVMFPIQDPVGRVIGFGGRVMTPTVDFAKYMNSPESIIYNKSRVLYGLFQAKEDIRKRDEVILVEGYLDVISLHQHGIKNVVATSGTALTPDQIKLVKRYTQKNFIFLYDGDNAGLKAMERSIELLFDEGLFPQIVMLPDGQDPDSYVQKLGSEAFLDYLTRYRKSFIEFIIEYSSIKGEGDNVQNRQQVIGRLIELISRFPDPVGREIMVQEVSRTTKVAQSIVSDALGKKLRNNRFIDQKRENKEKVGFEVVDIANITEKVEIRKVTIPEIDILKLISNHGKQITEFISYYVLPHYFQNLLAQTIFKKAIELSKEKEFWEFSELISLFEKAENEKDLLERISFEKYTISPKWKELGYDYESFDTIEKWTKDAIVQITLQFINSEIQGIQTILKFEQSEEITTIYVKRNQDLIKEKLRVLSNTFFSDQN